MQRLEAVNTAFIVASLFTKSFAFQIINCFVVISHLIFEHPRFQSFGFYITPFFVLCFPNSQIFWIAVLFSTIFCIVLPIPQLPKPTGSYTVGTITDYWEVEALTKKSFFSETTEIVKRKVFAKFWYPVDNGEGFPTSPYHVLQRDEIFKHDFRKHTGFGKLDAKLHFLTNHIFYLTQCHSKYGAPLSTKQNKWPVIIYEHGQGSLPEKNTALSEELASHGFIVCATYHEDFNKEWPGPLERRMHEIGFLMDRLVELNNEKGIAVGENVLAGVGFSSIAKGFPGFFIGKLNLDLGIGIYGHSFGGTSTTLICTGTENSALRRRIPKLQCGIAMDCWLSNLAHPRKLPIDNLPVMFLISDKWVKPDDLEKIKTLCECGKNGSYLVRVFDTAHYNFGDSYYLLRSIFGMILIPRMFLKENNSDMGLFGNSDGVAVHKHIRKFVIEFFKRHLINRESIGTLNIQSPMNASSETFPPSKKSQ